MTDPTELLKRLREDPKYREALGRARNAAERKAISELVEGLVTNAESVLAPIAKRVNDDPEFANELKRALIERHDVLTNQQPVSGSA